MVKRNQIQRSPEATINIAAPIEQSLPPRARGDATVSAKSLGTASVIGRLRQAGSLKVLFPRSEDRRLQAVLVNTAGGVTGGDRFSLEAEAETDAHLVLTTQAAERAYRAPPGPVGEIDNRLHVQSGARLDWLPQETILFEGCSLHRKLRVDLEADAELLLAEPLVFGRRAMGERVTQADFQDRITINRAGRPLYMDALRFQGDVEAQLDRPGVAGANRALATVLMASPRAAGFLEPIRALLPATGGASLIGEDLLVLRLLAQDSFELRRSMIPIFETFSGNPLPRPWMI